jgi:hypothetical protein
VLSNINRLLNWSLQVAGLALILVVSPTQAEVISTTEFDNISITHAQDERGYDFLQVYILSESGTSYLGLECDVDRQLQAFVIVPNGAVFSRSEQLIDVANAQPMQYSTRASVRMLANGSAFILVDAEAENPDKRPLALMRQLTPLGLIELYIPYVDSGFEDTYSTTSNSRVFEDLALFCGEIL